MSSDPITSDADGGEDLHRAPSKSSRKREMHALQALGEALVALPVEQLARVPIPDGLLEAVRDARRFTSHEARRRQLQYIGRLMRDIDPAPIRAQIEIFSGASKAEVARQHRLERLRDALLEDERRIGDVLALWPEADLQHLRTLRRNALKEREQSKPPRAYREIFRVLRDLDRSADDRGDTSEEENHTERQ